MDNRLAAVTLRHPSATWLPVVIWVFCLLVLADAVAEGTAGFVARVAFLVAAIALGAYVVLAKPALVLDDDGITVANVLRTHRIPFGALVDVRVGGLTSIVAGSAKGERTVTSWNAPGVKRSFPRRQDRFTGTAHGKMPARQATGESEIEWLIRNRWEAWRRSVHAEPGFENMTSRWNRQQAIALIALVAANIAIGLR